jgi:hypothetical protein
LSRRKKVLARVLSGTADANLLFDDVRHLLLTLNFQERIKGGHHIFSRSGVEEILNLQAKNGKAKPYQVKQVRELILKYRLGGALHD